MTYALTNITTIRITDIFVNAYMDTRLTRVDKLLKALADPTRLRIVGLLQTGEICVCHIHDSLKISQPKASRHLAYLRRAGVVAAEKRGQWVHYRLAEQPDEVAQTLLNAARHCAGHVQTVQRDAERLRRETGCCPVAAALPLVACCASTEPRNAPSAPNL
jgi:ArsR family transcriptional regulator